MQKGKLACVTVATAAIVTVVAMVEAVPYRRPLYRDQMDEENPEVMMEWLTRIGTYMRGHDQENTKRGLDLGLNRGFSGSQAAKHLMGLAAANYAGGPGRKRRSEHA